MYYVSDSTGQVDEFVVTIVTVTDRRMVTVVRGTIVTLGEKERQQTEWYVERGGVLERVLSADQLYVKRGSLVISSVQVSTVTVVTIQGVSNR